MLKQKARYFKIVFTIMLFCGALLSVDGFSDLNLLPRIFFISLGSVAFFLPFRKITLGTEEVLLLSFYLFNLLSCTWADNFSFAIYETQRTLLYFVAYFIGKRMVQSYGLLFVSKVVVVITATVVLVNAGMLIENSGSFKNFYTTSAHPNLLSSLLLLCLPFSLILFFRGQKRWKLFAAIIAFLIFLFIVGLGTRSVFLGVLLFGLVYTVIELKARGKKQFYSFVGLLAILTVGATALYFNGVIEINTTSLEERVFIWKKTMHLIGDQPLLGVGSGNWIFNYAMYGISGFDTFEIYGLVLQRPHNDLLWIIAELGMIGFAIISAFLLLTIKGLFNAKNSKERTLVFSGVISFLPVLLLSFPKERIEHIFLFFILLAVAKHIGGLEKKSVQANWVKYPVILLSLFSMMVVGFVAKGEWYSNQALQAMKNNEPELVISNNNKAMSFFYTHTNEGVPLASYTAWAYNQLRDKEKMVFYSQLAYSQAPNNYEVATNYGMALNSQKKFDEAEKILLRANYLNPRYDGAIVNLAIVYYNKEEYEKALKWIDQVYYKSELTNYYRGLIHEKLEIK